MTPTANIPSFGVLRSFQDFYVEIIGLKRQAHAPPMLPGQTGAVIEAQPEGGPAAEIWRKVTAILDRQSLETVHLGNLAAGVHREARFVMVALADEFFVHPRWEGTDYWLSHLLETRYFHTHSAGDVFFTKLTALLSSQEPATDELAALYLTALGLGFRGKYFGDAYGDAELRRLRVSLYELIRFRNPRLLDEGGHLFPDAYLSTLDKGIPRRLPDPTRWVGLAVAVVLFWFVVSFLLWRAISDDLRNALPEPQNGYHETSVPAKKQ